MTIECHILACDYDWVLPWTLRHYCSFADKVVVHDGGPSRGPGGTTWELCRIHGAVCKEWDTAGELNDLLAQNLKNTCWLGTDADWVICADADELIYFPGPRMIGDRTVTSHREAARYMLELYDNRGLCFIKPHGFEMFSDVMPVIGEHNQIYHAVRDGAPDDVWYSKPILFSPKRVAESGFGVGAHESRPVLKDGRAFNVDLKWPKAQPPVYMLHFHQVGSAEQVGARYDATRRRLSAINVRNGWGNVNDSGVVHVAHKRSLIVPNLRRVVG